MKYAAVIVMLLVGSSPAVAEPTTDYIVKDGDTCLGIAIGVLGDRGTLSTIHRLNPELGPTPHKLEAGQVLKLPAQKFAPDATLARTYNTVELRRAGVDTWSPAAVGAELFRAWRVGARERSNARVVFADRSAIEMRENTVVVIYGATSSTATTGPRRATLETGALRSRLAELDGRSLDVETTAGRVAVAAGSAIVEVVAGGRTLVSNHTGKPATLSNRGGSTKIAAGFGADAERGKKPSTARPLPPPPAWAAVATLVTGWTSTGATLRASWTASAAAARYRIELATTGGDTLAQIEVPATTTALELHRIPAGTYRLAIGSVDATGLEGVPAMSSSIEARLFALANEAAPAPIGIVDTTTIAAPRTVLLGSVLEVPADLACSADTAAAPAATVVFARAGETSIACRHGDTRASLPVVVAPVAVTAPPARSLALDQPLTIDIALSPPPPPGEIVARAEVGFVIDRVERTETGARVHLTPRRIGRGTIVLSLATAAGSVELGSAAIETLAPEVPPPPVKPVELPPHRVWLGVIGGAAIDGPARFALGGNVEAGVIPLLAVEAGGVYSDGRGVGELGLAVRHRLGPATPMLRAGAVLDTERRPGLYAGIGLRADLGGRLAGYGRVDTTIIGDDVVIDVLVGIAIGLGR